MPKGMGYKQRMDRQVKQPGGGYHGTGSVDNSYRYSKAKPPSGDAMRSSGFTRNPKQTSGGRQGDKNPFPTPHDSVGPWTGPKSGMRSKSHKGY